MGFTLKRKVLSKTMKKLVKTTLAVVFLAAIIIPYIIAAFYGNPSADDFTNAVGVLRTEGGNFFVKALRRSSAIYYEWQGTYTGNYLVSFGTAIFHNLGLKGLRLEFVAGIAFFFFSISAFLVCVLKANAKEIELWQILFGCTVVAFAILYRFNVNEILYWHTGLAVYTVPFCFGIIAVGLAFSLDKGWVKTALTAICAFLAVGGSLDISAFVCVTLLLGLIYLVYCKKSFGRVAILFAVAVIGSFINVLAPGNFARHDSLSESFPVFQSLRYAIVGVGLRNWGIVFGVLTPFLVLTVIVLWNNVESDRLEFINPILLAVALFCAEIVIDFPVYLGYSSNTFPNRCEFVSRVVAVLYLIVLFVDYIGWYKKKNQTVIQFNKQYVVLVALVVIMAITPFASEYAFENYFPFRIYNDMATGELDRYRRGNDVILSALENAHGEDVVVDIYEYSLDVDYIQSMRLRSDPEYWVNAGTAMYYENVNSISVNYK